MRRVPFFLTWASKHDAIQLVRFLLCSPGLFHHSLFLNLARLGVEAFLNMDIPQSSDHSAMNNETATPSDRVDADKMDPSHVHELVLRAKAGDQDAFGQIVTLYHQRVLNLAYRYVNHSDQAKDLAQQAWMKAWKKLDSFQGRSEFFTWMYRLVTFVCLDHLRQRKRRGEVAIPDGMEPSPVVGASPAPSAESNPVRNMQNAEVMDAFKKALERLSPEHRMVMVLREMEGLSYDEISKVMKCRKGTVMSRLYYARKQLQEMMKEFR